MPGLGPDDLPQGAFNSSSLGANLSREDKEEWLIDRMYYDSAIKSSLKGKTDDERDDYIRKKVKKMDEDDIEDRLYEDYGVDMNDEYDIGDDDYERAKDEGTLPNRKVNGVKLM